METFLSWSRMTRIGLVLGGLLLLAACAGGEPTGVDGISDVPVAQRGNDTTGSAGQPGAAPLAPPPPECVPDCTDKQCGDNGCGGTCGSCDDGNPCTTNTCNASNQCETSQVANGTLCDDGVYCTEWTTCQQGVCQGGVARDCSHLTDFCNTGVCNETEGRCVANTAPHHGQPCNDANICTVSDTCNHGVCVGQPMNCGHLDRACIRGVCSQEVGGCVEESQSQEGLSCDDGLFCTVATTCQQGQCLGQPRDCSAVGDVCNFGVCEESIGQCVTSPRPPETACDDGRWCTINDYCDNGSCTGHPRCDDGLSCTENYCYENGQYCETVPYNGRCQDGVGCNGAEICQVGVGCVPGTPPDCSMMNGPCSVGQCAEGTLPNTYTCNSVQLPNHTPCGGQNSCVTNETCQSGQCVGTPVNCDDGLACTDTHCDPLLGCVATPIHVRCFDGNPCTADICDLTQGCTNPPDDTATCTDNNACTFNDRCSNGACIATPVDCSHLNDGCTVGLCDTGNGQCFASNAQNGSACDDGNFCTVQDLCNSGVCNGLPNPCNDDIPCTADSCDSAAQACVNTPNHAMCDDQDPCTTNLCDPVEGCVAVFNTNPCNTDPCLVGQVCDMGVCTGGSPKVCDGYVGPCNHAVCDAQNGDPANGYCVMVNGEDGAPCTSEDWCTVNATCQSGACVGEPRTCDDGIDCTTDSCDPDYRICRHEENDQLCEDGNACTTTSCAAGFGCLTTFLQGYACDDGSLCTTNDICVNADIGCRGTPVYCGHLDAMCSVGVCNPATGQCVVEAVPEGFPCDDGNFCTVETVCNGGQCAGVPNPCDDGLDCTHDSCNVMEQDCVHTPIDTRCDDGNVCTDGVCDVQQGCVHLPNDNTCSDGNLCTNFDVCQGGTCVGVPMNCDYMNTGCSIGWCNPDTGDCESIQAPDGTGCNDGLWCTIGDTCSAGVCSGQPRDCSDAYDCTLDGCDEGMKQCTHTPDHDFCEDGNVCTTTYCSPLFGCGSEPLQGSCDDGDPCTEGDTCIDGLCTGFEVDCRAFGDACNTASCVDGFCQATPANNGTSCNDGLICTINTVCVDGACVGEPNPCNDGIACTVDSCNPATGCVHVPNHAYCANSNPCTEETCNPYLGCMSEEISGFCDDGNPCTYGDTCVEGRCTGVAFSCEHLSDACHVAVCNGDLGQCDVTYLGDGALCEDGLFCTVATSCMDGECVGVQRVCDDYVTCTVDTCDEENRRCVSTPDNGACEDLNPCTDNLCSPVSGCSNPPNQNACDDGDPCTIGDRCQAGNCVSGQARDCATELGPCRAGACNAQTGDCEGVDLDDGTPCEDGLFCTVGGACAAGVCVGSPRNCDDGVACTLSVCNEGLRQCAHTPDHALCEDGNPCTDNVCDLGQGCIFPPNQAACDDGNPCTLGDTCRAGACEPGSLRDCSGLDAPCVTGECDPLSGDCVPRMDVDGSPCHDGQFCRLDGQCESGVCTNQPTRDCDDTLDCTLDSCDEGNRVCSNLPRHEFCDDDDPCTQNTCVPSLGGCQTAALPDGAACGEQLQCLRGDCLFWPDGAHCGDPLPLVLEQPYSGTTEGFLNTQQAQDCAAAALEGPDIWFEFPRPEPGDYRLVLQPDTGADLVLVFAEQCEPFVCYSVLDQAGPGGEESLELTVSGEEPLDTLLFGVSSRDAEGAGGFSLWVEALPPTDGDEPNGDISDGDEPNGDIPDGDEPNGDISDGDEPNGDIPDGDEPNGDIPDGDEPNGDIPDGDEPDGDEPNGDIPDGDEPNGDIPDGDEPNGDIPDGDEPDGGGSGGGGGCRGTGPASLWLFLMLAALVAQRRKFLKVQVFPG